MKNLSFCFIALFFIASFAATAQRASNMPTEKNFYIQSAQSYNKNKSGYWDLPGHIKNNADLKKSLNVKIWELDDGIDRYFNLVNANTPGYYEIRVGNRSDLRVDVAGGKTTNGTNVLIWSRHGNANQQFLFYHLGGGKFKIYTRAGQIVNLKSQNSSNGNNVQIWGDHNGAHNEWYLIDVKTKKPIMPSGFLKPKLTGEKMRENSFFEIQSALSYKKNKKGYWDLPGNIKNTSELKKGMNLKIWEIDNGIDRLFSLKKSDVYYNIFVHSTNSKYVVDLSGGKTSNGTNAQIWEPNNSSAQDFYFKHFGQGKFKIYHRSGKILVLKNSNDSNGNNIHLWNDHDREHCFWYLIDKNGNPFIPQGSQKGVH